MTNYSSAHNLMRLIVVIIAASSAIIFLPSAYSTTAAQNNMPPGQHHQIPTTGELERLKGEEQRLAAMLASVRQQKLSVLRSRPLNLGIIGFGRFGQFMGQSFVKYANVIGTSRADYTNVANAMGAKYLSNLESFVMEEDLDVIVVAVSIVSFEDTVKDLVPHLKKRMEIRGSCPLIVDVLSVKEHARNVLLEHLPLECDILCTHPMFGPDSAKHGWQGQNFVYERTRVDTVLLDPEQDRSFHHHHNRFSRTGTSDSSEDSSLHERDEKYSEAHVAGVDRMERFLSIWEEEGCNMVSMSCSEHDGFTANSQFITHLTGRILGAQGLKATPVSILNTYDNLYSSFRQLNLTNSM